MGTATVDAAWNGTTNVTTAWHGSARNGWESKYATTWYDATTTRNASSIRRWTTNGPTWNGSKYATIDDVNATRNVTTYDGTVAYDGPTANDGITIDDGTTIDDGITIDDATTAYDESTDVAKRH